MHPVLARYLDLKAALETLSRADSGETLSPEDEQAFVDAANASPEQKSEILKAKPKGKPATQTQEALIYLAAHAAARALKTDAALSNALGVAKTALMSEGANEEDVHQFLASMVLEEAFGYEHDADEFDRPFFEETLKTVPELARLTQEKVRQLVVAFVKTAEPDDRPIFGGVAQALIETAWEDGPEPINPEHVEGALVAVFDKSGEAHKARTIEGMRRFIGFLARSGLLGPLRQSELLHVVERLAADVPGGASVKN